MVRCANLQRGRSGGGAGHDVGWMTRGPCRNGLPENAGGSERAAATTEEESRMTRGRFATVLLAVALLLAGLGVRNGSAQERLSIATGGTGGVYYPYGGGMENVVSDNLDGVDVTAEVISASVDKRLWIERGDA